MNVRNRGFTLLEVLIALAVISIALLALSRSSAQHVEALSGMQERTLALWVADNVITQTRLDRRDVSPGRYQGSQVMGRHEWHWDLLVQHSLDPAVLRLDVAVHRDAERHSAILQHTGFVKSP